MSGTGDEVTEPSHVSTTEPEKIDCPVDEDGDLHDPNNLFTCLVTEECCRLDLKPACCAEKDMSLQM